MSLARYALAAALLLGAAAPALAQARDPLAERAAELPAVLTWLQNQGVKLTYLGDEGGVRGYLGESANGKMQTFYVTPSGRNVVAGVMFETGGKNVTGVQIGEMRARFDAASQGLVGATVDGKAKASDAKPGDAKPSDPKADAKAANSPAPAADPAPFDAPAVVSPVEAPKAEAPKPEAPAAVEAPSAVPALPTAPAEVAPKAEAPKAPEAPAKKAEAGPAVPPPGGEVAGAMGDRSELWVSKIDKSEFLAAAGKAPFFEVGSLSAKPVIWMVADPQCPFCHKFWDYIRPQVYDRKVRVRVILIAGLKGSEPLTREILSRAVPARAWLDSDAGRKVEAQTPKDSPAWAKSEGFLGANADFAKKFGVDRTPFLAYEGGNGSLYTALGLPSDVEGFLTALPKH